MKLSKVLLFQFSQPIQNYETDTIKSNLALLTKAIRNPSDIKADKTIIPISSNGITLGVDRSDHFLINHYIKVPLKMQIVSPVSLYLKHMNELPSDLKRFCDISESHQVKYLQTHINLINSIWSREIESYESFMYSGKHKRAVIQGILTIILMTYHISKFYADKHDKNLYSSTIDELTSKITDLSDTNKLILLATEEILDLQQRYWCDSANKFSKTQEHLANQLVKDYIRQAKNTIENSINNQLPLSSDVNQEIQTICELLNDQNHHLCSTIILRGMTNTFQGLSTSADDFGSAIIHIHTLLEVPIFSQNQFVSRLSIGNIGFYVGGQRKKLDLPPYAYILNYTDSNLPENTPMVPDCYHHTCPPLSQIDTLQSDLCLGALITLNSTKVSKSCRLIDMPDSCIGLHVKSNTFLINGRGIYTPKDTKIPTTISRPTIVQGGEFVCPGKSISFKDYNDNQKLLTLDLDLSFQNFSSFDVDYDQIDQMFDNITFLSQKLSNLSETNVSLQIHELERTLNEGFYISTGISLLSILLTMLASVPLIQKIKNLLCNSKKPKIVKFADPELLIPLKFDPRVKSTPNLSKQ